MDLFRKTGREVGGLFGTVLGETINVASDITGSKTIKNVGDGVKDAATFAGESAGQAVDGVLTTTSGVIQFNGKIIDKGVDQICDSLNRTSNEMKSTLNNAFRDRDH